MTLWLLTAIVFAILWIFWCLLNFTLDLIAHGLEASPASYGAPGLDAAHDVGSWKRDEGTGDGALAIPPPPDPALTSIVTRDRGSHHPGGQGLSEMER